MFISYLLLNGFLHLNQNYSDSPKQCESFQGYFVITEISKFEPRGFWRIMMKEWQPTSDRISSKLDESLQLWIHPFTPMDSSLNKCGFIFTTVDESSYLFIYISVLIVLASKSPCKIPCFFRLVDGFVQFSVKKDVCSWILIKKKLKKTCITEMKK